MVAAGTTTFLVEANATLKEPFRFLCQDSRIAFGGLPLPHPASSDLPSCRIIAVTCHKKRSPDGLLAFRFHLPESGRAGEIRTHDLLHPMQAFYQAELQPAIRFGLFGGTAVWRVVKRFQVPDAFFPKHSAGTSWNRVGEGIVPALRRVHQAWP